MTEPYTGGCACGAIRYQVDGEPAVMNDCHCRQCQRESGTGHGSHMTFVGAEVTLTGEASHWETVGEAGTRKRRGFCPTCGNPVYLSFPDMPQVFVASAASLDDPSRYRPSQTLWATASQRWDRLDPAIMAFEKMPPQPGE